MSSRTPRWVLVALNVSTETTTKIPQDTGSIRKDTSVRIGSVGGAWCRGILAGHQLVARHAGKQKMPSSAALNITQRLETELLRDLWAALSVARTRLLRQRRDPVCGRCRQVAEGRRDKVRHWLHMRCPQTK